MEKITGRLVTGIIIGLVTAAVLAGCGGEEKPATVTAVPAGTATTSTDGGARAATTLEISLKNIKFSQPDVTIDAGTKVKWTNEDSVNHTVTANDNKFDSGVLGKGQTFEFTFSEPGTYEYKCTIHPSQMKGKITVK